MQFLVNEDAKPTSQQLVAPWSYYFTFAFVLSCISNTAVYFTTAPSLLPLLTYVYIYTEHMCTNLQHKNILVMAQ